MTPPHWLPSGRRLALGLAGAVLIAAIAGGLWWWRPWQDDRTGGVSRGRDARRHTSLEGYPTVEIDADQRSLLGIETATVEAGKVSAVLGAPGQVIPDESRFAYITPRAEGIVRSVSAQIGQRVERGELLAQIDSSAVARARLDLIDSLLRLEIARARLNWQETIYQNSLELIDALEGTADPADVQRRFAEKPIGRTREELLKAYAQYYLARITADRYEDLQEKQAVSVALAQEKRAEYQVGLATYQGLMDRMAYEVTLEYTRARQALREARTAVKVARETLRVYGVPVEEILARFESGELTGNGPTRDPEPTLRQAAEAAIEPSREVSSLFESDGPPVSTYELRAPFTGTILERERIVPGVVVDGTHHLFTMANLETVWVEAHVHEGDFNLLARGRGGRIEFTSPAYPGRTFPGTVLYTGDLVDPKSRTVRLLATAVNPDRLLKPGMFVSIEIFSKQGLELPLVPESALLTDDRSYFAFVRVGPGRFRRRDVEVGDREGGLVSIPRGLEPGEEVVVRGAFEIKAVAQAGERAAVDPS